MLTQKLVGTVINGLGAPVSGTITATTFPNSAVSNDLITKTVITAPVGIDGKFVIYVPKLVECSIKITSGTTTAYSTVIGVTNDNELDLSVYAATPPPYVADPFTLHMQNIDIHTPVGASHTHDNKAYLDLVSGTNTGDQDLTGLLNETAHDLLDHSGLTGVPTTYSLPTASTTVLGGVKIDGSTILVSDGVISSTGGAGGGVTDHGLLTGLADDDHSQYHTDARGDARYSRTTHDHAGVYAQALGVDDNYVTDAEKIKLSNLSGTNTGDQNLSGYSLTTHNHSLNNLTEKSYNSLTDKPSIPSVAGLLDETAHDLLSHVGLTGVLALGTTGTTACAGNDSRLSDARPASDVSAWAKAATKPAYTYTEVGAAPSLGADDNYVTDAEKTKLAGIADGAETNVNADWNAVSGDAQILNRPATFAPASHGNEAHSSTFATTAQLHAAVTIADSTSIDLTLTGQQISAAAIFGTTSGTVTQGNDTRLSDSRTPTSHTTASHADWPAAVTMTEVGYLDGVTSAIQTQIGDIASALDTISGEVI